MRSRAWDGPPVTLLVLALAAFACGCSPDPPALAAAQEGAPLAASTLPVAAGIPVTGFALEVVGCDPGGTFLNFRLSNAPAGQTAAQLRVELGGRPATCRTPLGDPSILSCTIPPLTLFPAPVVVRMGDLVVTEFEYDSGLCPVALPVTGGQAEPAPPAPTAVSIDAGQPTSVRPEAKPATAAPTLWAPFTALPTWDRQPIPTEPPTQPPPSEPPPTQPPSTEAPPTEAG